MAKKDLSEIEIAESIPDLWMPLTPEQREFLAKNFTIQKFRKNETIYIFLNFGNTRKILKG